MLEYQNVKTFLQNTMFQFDLKKVFVIKKVETNVLRTYVTSNLKFAESVGTFYEKELRKI